MSDRWSHQDYAEILRRRGGRSTVVEAWQRSCGVPISREVKHDYKAEFEQQLSLVGIQVEREYFFHPSRKWRSDWIVKGTKVLVEFEGGLFKKRAAGHSSVTGILRDLEKYNEATLLGFIVIRIAPNHVRSGEALQWVERAIVLDQLGLTESDTSQTKSLKP